MKFLSTFHKTVLVLGICLIKRSVGATVAQSTTYEPNSNEINTDSPVQITEEPRQNEDQGQTVSPRNHVAELITRTKEAFTTSQLTADGITTTAKVMTNDIKTNTEGPKSENRKTIVKEKSSNTEDEYDMSYGDNIWWSRQYQMDEAFNKFIKQKVDNLEGILTQILSALNPDNAVSICDKKKGWIQEPEISQNCYYFSRTIKSWYDAKSYCQRLGGDLVTIETMAELDFVFEKTKKTNLGKGPWMDLRENKQKMFVWVEKHDYPPTWATIDREYDEAENKTGCGNMHGEMSNYWQIRDCSDKLYFVCEKEFSG